MLRLILAAAIIILLYAFVETDETHGALLAVELALLLTLILALMG